MYVDKDKIFDLFSPSDDENKKFVDTSEMSYLVEDYKNHPLFWVGMFKKLIYNHKTFSKKVIQFFEKMNEELDLFDVENAGEFIAYNRAWYWIEKVDLSLEYHQEALHFHSDEILLSSVKFAISYFEESEEYEKCAHLKKIQNLIESFLK
jgi:hypothetical protein